MSSELRMKEIEMLVEKHIGKPSLLDRLRIRRHFHRLEIAARKGKDAFYEELRRIVGDGLK